MGLWNTDLSTPRSARRAAELGSLGCFVLAGLTLLAGFMARDVINPAQLEGQISVVLIILQAIVGIVAGIRLRGGRGVYWAMAVVALLLLEIVTKLVTMSGLPGLIINIALLVIVIHGIRGAMALRSTDAAEEDGAAFE